MTSSVVTRSVFNKVFYVSVSSNWVHPPGQPPGKVLLKASESRPPGQFFCLILCPGAKNDGRIPGGGAEFFPKSKKLLLKLVKNP